MYEQQEEIYQDIVANTDPFAAVLPMATEQIASRNMFINPG